MNPQVLSAIFYAFEEQPGQGVCVAEIVGGLSLLCAGNKSSKLAVSRPMMYFVGLELLKNCTCNEVVNMSAYLNALKACRMDRGPRGGESGGLPFCVIDMFFFIGRLSVYEGKK